MKLEQIAPVLAFGLCFGVAYGVRTWWTQPPGPEPTAPLPVAEAVPQAVVEALLVADALRVAADTLVAVGEPLAACGSRDEAAANQGRTSQLGGTPCWDALGAPKDAVAGGWWLDVEGARFALHGLVEDGGQVFHIVGDAQPARRVAP